MAPTESQILVCTACGAPYRSPAGPAPIAIACDMCGRESRSMGSSRGAAALLVLMLAITFAGFAAILFVG
ncbi:MAG TPA: hypothetical protein VKE69_07335 [Planctomycetota bacterium]|nr:hypothetical protein [Planctomycetota bacterium]